MSATNRYPRPWTVRIIDWARPVSPIACRADEVVDHVKGGGKSSRIRYQHNQRLFGVGQHLQETQEFPLHRIDILDHARRGDNIKFIQGVPQPGSVYHVPALKGQHLVVQRILIIKIGGPDAEHGLIGLIFGNSPKAIAPWGGNRGVFGTNPIAFATPRKTEPPLVIDLSLSKVARGKVMTASESGDAIPEGWALDVEGRPTTDPKAALEGTMLPMGDAKGAALVLMVEILSAALTNANFGFEASSFFSPEGPPPGVGQLLLVLLNGEDLLALEASGDDADLVAALRDDGRRQPGVAQRRCLEGAVVGDHLGLGVEAFHMVEIRNGAWFLDRE